MKKQRLSQKLQLNKITIVGLSTIHTQAIKGGDGTDGPVQKPPTPPPPPPTKTKTSVAMGNECTVVGN